MFTSPRDSIIVIVLLSSVLLLVATVGIHLALKFKQYRSRPYLFASSIFLFQSLGIAGTILRTILNGQVYTIFDTILRPISLITGLLTLLCILAYIIEIKRPGKLNLKQILFAISPIIIVSVLLILVHPSPLHSLEEVFKNINHFDVLIRLVIIFFYIAYPIVAACLPYEWRQCLVSKKTITSLHILSCIASPMFIAGMICGIFPAIILNYITAIIFDFLVAYIELKIRIPVTHNYDPHKEQETSANDSIIDSPEIWMNPDMTAVGLARIMGTNHTYLLDRIKKLGYSSYSDMINRKRVEYICKKLDDRTDVNIISLMYEAGFRSRSTASREFKRIVGCTPSEFQESISK